MGDHRSPGKFFPRRSPSNPESRPSALAAWRRSVNALCPASTGAALRVGPGTGKGTEAVPRVVPATTPRLYHPSTLPQCQPLKHLLETEWVPQLQREFKIDTTSLPMIWDCDFLLGPKTASGDDTYVLCEINVSCVSPFPESAIDVIAHATVERVRDAKQRRSAAS